MSVPVGAPASPFERVASALAGLNCNEREAQQYYMRTWVQKTAREAEGAARGAPEGSEAHVFAEIMRALAERISVKYGDDSGVRRVRPRVGEQEQ